MADVKLCRVEASFTKAVCRACMASSLPHWFIAFLKRDSMALSRASVSGLRKRLATGMLSFLDFAFASASNIVLYVFGRCRLIIIFDSIEDAIVCI
jgi:hypothetical protein